MNKTKLTALVAGTALAALAAGCAETTTTNTNANANTNTAIVTNTNTTHNANTGTATTTNTTTTTRTSRNYNYNANISQAEYEKDKDRYSREAKDAGDTIGATATDGWLWVKTRGALAGVDDLEDSNINVDVDNGVIILKGNLPTAAQKAAAVKAAQGIEGKKSVKDELKVSASGESNSNTAHSNANTKS